MTKRQVKAKINKLFKEHTERLVNEIDAVLHESDMWYGESESCVNDDNIDDRNADLLAYEGMFEKDDVIGNWLHSRKELGL